MSALFEPTRWLPLDWVLVVVAAWLLVGVLGVFALRHLGFVAKVLFPVGGAIALLLFAVAFAAMFSTPDVVVLPLGLPGLPFHLRLDSLAEIGTSELVRPAHVSALEMKCAPDTSTFR